VSTQAEGLGCSEIKPKGLFETPLGFISERKSPFQSPLDPKAQRAVRPRGFGKETAKMGFFGKQI